MEFFDKETSMDKLLEAFIALAGTHGFTIRVFLPTEHNPHTCVYLTKNGMTTALIMFHAEGEIT